MTLFSVCCSDLISGDGAPLHPPDLLESSPPHSVPFPCIAVNDEMLAYPYEGHYGSPRSSAAMLWLGHNSMTRGHLAPPQGPCSSCTFKAISTSGCSITVQAGSERSKIPFVTRSTSLPSSSENNLFLTF